MKNDVVQIVILAGGLGTRLRPLTEQVPKAMVLVNGRPFIDYQLKWLAQSGIQEVILSTGYLGHQIREYVKEGQDWGLRVLYVEEGPNLMGTGGALRLVFDRGLLRDSFLVTYGDSFLPVNFKGVWEAFLNGSEPALMTVLKNGEKWDSSNVCYEGGKVTLYDKKAVSPKPPAMQFIDYGLSAFKKSVIESQIPTGEKFDLSDLFHSLSIQGQLSGFEVQNRFYEIGSMTGLQELESHLESRINSQTPSF